MREILKVEVQTAHTSPCLAQGKVKERERSLESKSPSISLVNTNEKVAHETVFEVDVKLEIMCCTTLNQNWFKHGNELTDLIQ